jgi:hypothetical protein
MEEETRPCTQLNMNEVVAILYKEFRRVEDRHKLARSPRYRVPGWFAFAGAISTSRVSLLACVIRIHAV